MMFRPAEKALLALTAHHCVYVERQIGVIKMTDSDTFSTALHTLACIQLI